MNRITINTEEAGEVKLKDHVREKYTRQYQKFRKCNVCCTVLAI